jgi:hypothetical protein
MVGIENGVTKPYRWDIWLDLSEHNFLPRAFSPSFLHRIWICNLTGPVHLSQAFSFAPMQMETGTGPPHPQSYHPR